MLTLWISLCVCLCVYLYKQIYIYTFWLKHTLKRLKCNAYICIHPLINTRYWYNYLWLQLQLQVFLSYVSISLAHLGPDVCVHFLLNYSVRYKLHMASTGSVWHFHVLVFGPLLCDFNSTFWVIFPVQRKPPPHSQVSCWLKLNFVYYCPVLGSIKYILTVCNLLFSAH